MDARSLEEVSEGAVRDDGVDNLVGGLLDLSEDIWVGGVGFPLGLEFEIVVHSLVTEEHVIVAPEGGNHGGGSLELSDELLGTAKLGGHVGGVDVEEGGASGDSLQVIKERLVVGVGGHGELTSWLKAERPGEDDGGLKGTILGSRSHV